MLAQVFAAPPPELPRPPLWESLLLESPAVLVAALMGLGVVVLLVLRRAGRPRGGTLAAGVLVLLGVAAAVLALFVETDREAVTAATRGLVRATAAVDRPGMDRLLAQDARLLGGLDVDGLRSPGAGLTKPAILDRVADVLGRRYPLESATVVECQAEVAGSNTARTQAHVRVRLAGWGVPHNSWWRLEWRRDPDGWRAVTIFPVSLDGAAR